MKAIRSLILYCIAGFAIFAYFSYEDWLDQINASLDGYASVENYREAQKLGASDREAYLAIKKAAAEKAQKEKEEKERLARIEAEKEKKGDLRRLIEIFLKVRIMLTTRTDFAKTVKQQPVSTKPKRNLPVPTSKNSAVTACSQAKNGCSLKT